MSFEGVVYDENDKHGLYESKKSLTNEHLDEKNLKKRNLLYPYRKSRIFINKENSGIKKKLFKRSIFDEILKNISNEIRKTEINKNQNSKVIKKRQSYDGNFHITREKNRNNRNNRNRRGVFYDGRRSPNIHYIYG
ncbi:Hypothetical protein SRAE_2000068800 [Strongyloides ratti]|uniref:Uncharacterized protein n=1 Tax=Strongyloides ratti TaxID=34506 RepID=A0A090LEP9_STRRB|nr:Hypothetical protein SRAE_2000068800 [Strongyloides ratti]CEF66015.1 Hypothetical protein SRAE_2000068800 [Strongyloides ratti]